MNIGEGGEIGGGKGGSTGIADREKFSFFSLVQCKMTPFIAFLIFTFSVTFM